MLSRYGLKPRVWRPGRKWILAPPSPELSNLRLDIQHLKLLPWTAFLSAVTLTLPSYPSLCFPLGRHNDRFKTCQTLHSPRVPSTLSKIQIPYQNQGPPWLAHLPPCLGTSSPQLSPLACFSSDTPSILCLKVFAFAFPFNLSIPPPPVYPETCSPLPFLRSLFNHTLIQPSPHSPQPHCTA